MQVLLCGSDGLVGSALSAELQKNDAVKTVFAADIRHADSSPIGKIRPVLNEQIEDLLRTESIDVMVLLAFPRNVTDDRWAPGIRYAHDLLWKAKQYGVSRVIHLSSQSLYGLRRTEPADESSPILLNSPYTTGKYCLELLINSLFADRPHTNIRLSTVIAPTTRERVPNKLFRQLLDGRTLTIQGGGQVFSFLDVRDAAAGLAAVITSENRRWREAYNLGTVEHITLSELARTAVSIYTDSGAGVGRYVVEEADVVLNNQIKVDAFREDFGWEAGISLRRSLEDIFNYMRSHP